MRFLRKFLKNSNIFPFFFRFNILLSFWIILGLQAVSYASAISKLIIFHNFCLFCCAIWISFFMFYRFLVVTPVASETILLRGDLSFFLAICVGCLEGI